jgi:hypothetical protein
VSGTAKYVKYSTDDNGFDLDSLGRFLSLRNDLVEESISKIVILCHFICQFPLSPFVTY